MNQTVAIALIAAGTVFNASFLTFAESASAAAVATTLRSVRPDSGGPAAEAVPSGHEPQSRSRPPFPGSRKLNEILENVRADMVATERDRLPGLSRIHDLASLKVTRFIEVKADAPKDEYYLIDLDTLDGKPFLSVTIERDSGLIQGIAWNFVNGERAYKLPALETVADRLKTLYGVADVTYYDLPQATIYQGMGFAPLIVGQTAAKRRVIVDFRLNVFEEIGFEKRPPGLTDEEHRAWGERLVRENNAVISTNDGEYKLRLIGKLDVERR